MSHCVIDVFKLACDYKDINDGYFDIADSHQPTQEDLILSKIYNEIIRPNSIPLLVAAIRDAVDADLAWTKESHELDTIIENLLGPYIQESQHRKIIMKMVEQAILTDIRITANGVLDIIVRKLWGKDKCRDSFRWQVLEINVFAKGQMMVFCLTGDYRIKVFHELLADGKISLGRSKQSDIPEPRPKQQATTQQSEPPRVKDRPLSMEEVRNMVIHKLLNSNPKNIIREAIDDLKKSTYASEEFDGMVYTPKLTDIEIDTTSL